MKINQLLKSFVITFFFLSSLSIVTGQENESAPVKPEGVLLVERDDGTFIQVDMNGVFLEITMLDENYVEMDNIFTRGFGKIEPAGKKKTKLILTKSSDGKSLRSVNRIGKPYVFKIRMHLFKGEDDSNGEFHFINYNQFSLRDKGLEKEADLFS